MENMFLNRNISKQKKAFKKASLRNTHRYFRMKTVGGTISTAKHVSLYLDKNYLFSFNF